MFQAEGTAKTPQGDIVASIVCNGGTPSRARANAERAVYERVAHYAGELDVSVELL